MIDLLAPAFVACLLLAGVLSYFGLHVLLREVIFVDLALAQLAALGVAVAHMVASEASPATIYLWSFAFTLAGAAIFAGVRTERRRVPQEALIGIVYGVSAALVILVLSKSALDRGRGREHAHGPAAVRRVVGGRPRRPCSARVSPRFTCCFDARSSKFHCAV